MTLLTIASLLLNIFLAFCGYYLSSELEKKENRSETHKRAELTTITTSDGKEYDIENDCLIRKSEAIKQIYEKCLGIDNPDIQNGLTGAVVILWNMIGEGE